MFTGYEIPNRYQVYFKNKSDTNYTMLFMCKEQSECCERNCCEGGNRPFIMNMHHMTSNNMNFESDDNIFCVVNKPYVCTCYCCGRPEMTGNFKSGMSFGSVYVPFSCYDPVVQVKNSHGEVNYSITTEYCKCGFYCRGGCGMFEPITLPIFVGENCDAKNFLNACGKIIKHSMGLQALFSDADNYEVIFPNNCTPEDKLGFILATLMIDYCYFEQKQNAGHGRGHHY